MDKGDEDNGRVAKLAAALVSLHAERRKEFALPVEGRSMGPALGPSCEVLVRPMEGMPRFGDVVLFRRKNDLVVHRVIGRTRTPAPSVITKGDLYRERDEPVAPGDIMGRVVGVRRNGQLWGPWQWKRPFSTLAALLSWLEAAGGPRIGYLLHRIHWQWHLVWLNLTRQVSEKEKAHDR